MHGGWRGRTRHAAGHDRDAGWWRRQRALAAARRPRPGGLTLARITETALAMLGGRDLADLTMRRRAPGGDAQRTATGAADQERRMRTHSAPRRLRGRLAAGAVAASALVAGGPATASAAAGPAAGATAGPVVQTHSGAVRGTTVNGVREFLGIPYAAPPVGRLRWHAPEPPARWAGIRPATAFAPHCPQVASPFGEASTSEDCLFLNVFTPAHAIAGTTPVIVWIHGGALVTGESDDYDPAALVSDGVTVVTINYRLGALGFLADSALANPAGAAGNYGLMDQQAALRWVRANITGFGGSRRNVTVAGESAGGVSVLAALASPGARGLFQRAIVESGTHNVTETPLATAESQGAAFAAKVGCGSAGSAAAAAACLRQVPVAPLLASQGTTVPDVDGLVLRQQITTAVAAGEFNRVPVIMGTNRDEWRLFVGAGQLQGVPAVTPANYQALISGTLSVPAATAAQIAAQYPLSDFPDPGLALGAVGTDAIFACPSLSVESALSRFVPTFGYEFNDQNAPERFIPSVGFPYGAAHASELQYLFGLPTAPIAGALDAAQQRLAAQMQRYWASEAAFGSPQTPGQPRWPLLRAQAQRLLSLSEPQPAVETDFAAEHQCAFWNATLPLAGLRSN
jgi:para-nitrobenzyl esterase